MLSFSNLHKVVNEDRWHRFELLYDPLKGKDADSWWIRVKENDVRFFLYFGLAFIEFFFSTNRKKILKSIRYYLRTNLESPSTARPYRPGDLIYVSSNLPSYSFQLTPSLASTKRYLKAK